MDTEYIEILFNLAQDGDADAMLQLGSYYFDKLDFDSALSWYQKAIDNGNNNALMSMAYLHKQLDIQAAAKDMQKNSESVDYTLSDITIDWYEKALDYFDKNYEDNIEFAVCAADLLSGEDAFKIDYEKAFEYFRYAAKYKGNDEYDKELIKLSQARLGKMYELGLGHKKNSRLSKLYRKKSQIDDETYQNLKFYE